MNQKGGKENCPVHQVGWARGGGGGLRRRSSAHLFILVDVCSSSAKKTDPFQLSLKCLHNISFSPG